jgi:hypothetical protein
MPRRCCTPCTLPKFILPKVDFFLRCNYRYASFPTDTLAHERTLMHTRAHTHTHTHTKLQKQTHRHTQGHKKGTKQTSRRWIGCADAGFLVPSCTDTNGMPIVPGWVCFATIWLIECALPLPTGHKGKAWGVTFAMCHPQELLPVLAFSPHCSHISISASRQRDPRVQVRRHAAVPRTGPTSQPTPVPGRVTREVASRPLGSCPFFSSTFSPSTSSRYLLHKIAHVAWCAWCVRR